MRQGTRIVIKVGAVNAVLFVAMATDPLHEELVEIGADNGKELDALRG